MGEYLHIGFQLEEFTVRPVKNVVEGPSGSIHVSPRAMELLLALARKPGFVVSRGQLKEMVWGKEQVSTNVVTRSVGELRHVLGDSAESPRFIQTIPGRGYRLIPDPLPLDSPVTDPGVAMFQSGEAENESGSFFGFFTDLARRKVYRIAASYLVAAWVILQVADVILDALPLPDYSMTFVVVALAMGFPVAVVLAWAFQWTPQGLMVEGRGGRLRAIATGASPGKLVYGIAAVSAVAVGIGAYLLTATESVQQIQTPSAESIAVLPFVNFSDDKANEYFSDGLTEEVLNVLAQLGDLQVASRTSSFYYKGQDQNIQKIAQALNVHYVLEGSVRLAGESMRITAQLIDGTNGFHLWSGTYDRETNDVFAVQSDIARQVARNLKIVMSNNIEDALGKTRTENFEAYDAYLRGRDYLRRPSTEANLQNAGIQFQQSLMLDPAYGMAYAGICETRLRQYQINPDTELFEDAEKACNRAMTRDGQSAEVSLALGRLHLLTGQSEQALGEIDRALTLKPRWVEAILARAEALAVRGFPIEAEAEFKRLIQIDPGYAQAYKTFGNFYYHNGRFDDAIANYNEVIKRIPDDWGVYSNFASAYYMKGDLQSAAEIWLKLAEENEDPTMFANIGSMYFYLRRFEDAVGMYVKAAELTSNVPEYWGNQGEAYRQIPDGWNKAKAAYNKAIALAEEQFLINPNNYDLMTQTAVFYSGLGNFDKAFDLLAKVHAAGNVDYYYYYQAALVYVRAGNPVKAEDALMRSVEMGYPKDLLSVDAGLDPLQGRLRFEALVDDGRK